MLHQQFLSRVSVILQFDRYICLLASHSEWFLFNVKVHSSFIMDEYQHLETFYEYEVPKHEQGTVNSPISKRDNTGGAINYARCARVLRRLDSCPGVLTASNMSTMQNSSTMSSICNTREPLWAEDFIDLSEFCQPSNIPTKMEDLADEHVTSPISSTVHDHGFDYALEVNDGLDNTIEDNLWCMGSPIAMQEELCDPISDWLTVTKETNNNDNLDSRSQIYNINDTLLSPTFTSVPKIAAAPPQYRKEVNFAPSTLPSPPLQPDTTFFDSIIGDNVSADLSPQNLFKTENSLRLATTTTGSLFTEKLPDTTYTFQNPPNVAVALMNERKDVPALSRVTVDTSVSSPCSVQSPSITQSNLNQEEKPNCGIINRRNVKLKLKTNETPRTSTCALNTPEMLQPLVNKNSEFDLVSYVFDDNKPSMSFDISSLHSSSSSIGKDTSVTGSAVSTKNVVSPPKPTPVIKLEPKEDEEQKISVKRTYETDDSFYPAKRSRRFSNTSQLDLDDLDLTQLESEKYRELRNRNNEASRRSRANRKSREVEMRDHASHLEAENRRLKVKAEEMEKLVKRLRNCLMQLVLKRR